MKARALAVVLLLALLGAPACGGGGGEDDGYRLELDGKARVTSSGHERTFDGGTHGLAIGDTVEMLDGDAVLGLPGDRSMLLRSDGDDASVVQVGSTPDLVDGDAVAIAAGDAMHLTAGDVDVRIAHGAARMQRGLGVTIAMYAGSATVRSAGRELVGGLPALRQVSVAATGLLPRQPVPLVYDDHDPDPWDLRFLGDAIELGGFLDTEAKGFTSQLGPRAAVDATLLQRVLPPLADQGWVGDELSTAQLSAGEALVGGAIVVESGGTLGKALWSDVFSFREQGARWGLVALDQQVKRDALKDRLRDALGRSPLLFAAGPRPSASGGSDITAPPTTTTTTPPSGGGSTTTEPPTTTPTPTPTLPPATVPPTTIPLITIPTLLQGSDTTPTTQTTPTTTPADRGAASPPSAPDVVHEVVDLVGNLTTTPSTLLP